MQETGNTGSIPGSWRSPGVGNGTHSISLAWRIRCQRSLADHSWWVTESQIWLKQLRTYACTAGWRRVFVKCESVMIYQRVAKISKIYSTCSSSFLLITIILITSYLYKTEDLKFVLDEVEWLNFLSFFSVNNFLLLWTRNFNLLIIFGITGIMLDVTLLL